MWPTDIAKALKIGRASASGWRSMVRRSTPLAYQARGDVGSASGCPANDDAHRPGGIDLRPGYTRSRGKHGGAHREVQKSL
jgi:hypothetical protein